MTVAGNGDSRKEERCTGEADAFLGLGDGFSTVGTQHTKCAMWKALFVLLYTWNQGATSESTSYLLPWARPKQEGQRRMNHAKLSQVLRDSCEPLDEALVEVNCRIHSFSFLHEFYNAEEFQWPLTKGRYRGIFEGQFFVLQNHSKIHSTLTESGCHPTCWKDFTVTATTKSVPRVSKRLLAQQSSVGFHSDKQVSQPKGKPTPSREHGYDPVPHSTPHARSRALDTINNQDTPSTVPDLWF